MTNFETQGVIIIPCVCDGEGVQGDGLRALGEVVVGDNEGNDGGDNRGVVEGVMPRMMEAVMRGSGGGDEGGSEGMEVIIMVKNITHKFC